MQQLYRAAEGQFTHWACAATGAYFTDYSSYFMGPQTFTEVTAECGAKNKTATQARKHIWNPSQTGQQPDVHNQNSRYLPKVVSVLRIV